MKRPVRKSPFYRFFEKRVKPHTIYDSIFEKYRLDRPPIKDWYGKTQAPFPWTATRWKEIEDYLALREEYGDVHKAVQKVFHAFYMEELKGKIKADKPVHLDRSITLRERFEVLKRYGFRCYYCGASAPKARLEIDHKVPLSKGGANDQSNRVPACWSCNRGKGDIGLEPDESTTESPMVP